jgi:hypothetical protein
MIEISGRGMLRGVAMSRAQHRIATTALWTRTCASRQARTALVPLRPRGAEDRAVQRRHRQGSECHRLPGLGKVGRRYRMGYVIEGNCRVTTIDPAGQWETVDFGPARTWPLDPRAWALHLHLPPRVRPRLFLGVRHVLYQRLGRAHAARARCSSSSPDPARAAQASARA